MNFDLFRYALQQIQPSHWKLFEDLASAFLAVDYPQLRTMAHPTGDGGRDSELFQPDGKPLVCFQYSISKNWKPKITQTASRLAQEFPDVRMLVYLTNQQIGARGDTLKRKLLDLGLSLDIRDINWFLERAELDDACMHAAEYFIDRIARPILSDEHIIHKPSSPLTLQEAQAALVYLGLQWQDDITDKGLTKLSFDALVRAALRKTHSDHRMSRKEVHETIKSYLSGVDENRLTTYVNSALKRLTKRYIRHWQKEDEFCLTHEEHKRIQALLAKKENEETAFIEEIERRCEEYVKELGNTGDATLADLLERLPRVLENLLYRRGEIFATAVTTGRLERIGFERLNDVILDDLSKNKPKEANEKFVHYLPKIVNGIIRDLLGNPSEPVQIYLKRLSNSYTLFSFLRETPDVQSATRKLLSHGKIWIDTTVLLPLFAERLYDEEGLHKLTRTFSVCRETGIELCVTRGIVQEVNSHMNNALACSRSAEQPWQGRTPYLYYQYLAAGNPPSGFGKWLSLFRGSERPEEDIILFLEDVLGIKQVELAEEAQKVEEELRWTVNALWEEAHRKRRQRKQQEDMPTTDLLIRHDVETYLGVIALRQAEHVTELGYKHWLLTLDRIAWQIRDLLREGFRDRVPPSPLLSLDFLINNLTFGSIRRQINWQRELTLPVILDIEMSESMPFNIVEIANKVRSDNEGLPEYVIRRKVRDAIDQARRRRVLSKRLDESDDVK